MFAKKWTPACDARGWLMSEKLDGYGTNWDGENFYSREGNLFHVPQWFKKGLPRVPLDGELWVGRGKFEEAASIVSSQQMSDAWKRVTFNVFDAPGHPGGFEERIAAAEQLVKGAPYAKVVRHRRCKGAPHIESELKRVEGLGGEGLVLRGPSSPYEGGRRVSSYLKVKSFHDAEAVVTGYSPGKGKHAGVVGGLWVETLGDDRTAPGIRFKLGTGLSDEQRRRPPPIGTVVTYRYQGGTGSGKPRFASFLRVRKNPWSRS